MNKLRGTSERFSLMTNYDKTFKVKYLHKIAHNKLKKNVYSL